MNKYALGTIIGTTLLGLTKAKAKIGSQVKLKTGRIYTGKIKLDITNIQNNDGSEHNFDDMFKRALAFLENQQLNYDSWYVDFSNDSHIVSTLRIIMEREVQEKGSFEIPLDITVVIDQNIPDEKLYEMIRRSVKRELEPYGFKAVMSTSNEWEKTAKNSLLRKGTFEDGIIMQQYGEWVPYKKTEPTISKLRKR